ncbi:MAG: hypothetical protein ABIG95_05835 [Candidatus Woesearchaeota archaeon]
MNKKGVELTFNTIIIATICLIVLVVVIMIFTNFTSSGNRDLVAVSSCESMSGGSCGPKQEGKTCLKDFGGCGDNMYCCFSK